MAVTQDAVVPALSGGAGLRRLRPATRCADE